MVIMMSMKHRDRDYNREQEDRTNQLKQQAERPANA